MLHVCLPVHVVHVHVHVILSCTCPGVHVHVYVPAWRRSRALHSTAANATLPTVPHITVRAPQRPKGAAQDVPTSRCCHDYLLLTSHARHSLRLTGRTRYTGTRAHSCGALHVMLSSTLSRGQAPRHARHHALPWSGPPRTYSPPGASGGGGARVPGSEAPLHYHMSKVQLSKQLVVCVSNWLRNLQLRALSTSAAPVRLIGLRGDHV